MQSSKRKYLQIDQILKTIGHLLGIIIMYLVVTGTLIVVQEVVLYEA